MVIYSDKTGKKYETVEECLKAEKEFEDAKKKELEKRESLKKERNERAKEVEEAYKNYVTLLNAFIKDYKSFHMTYTDESFPTLLESLFNWF